MSPGGNKENPKPSLPIDIKGEKRNNEGKMTKICS